MTPNTLQLGGALEVGLAAGPLNISGILGTDVLIQYVPFAFDVRIYFAARVRWNSSTIGGVRVEGTLSGPGPTRLRGRACIEVFFFDICRSGEIRLGSDAAPQVATVISVVQALALELDQPNNLESTVGDQSGVVLSADTGMDRVRVSPDGVVAWRQRRAPLALELDRFEGSRLESAQSVVVQSSAAIGPVHDDFSPGNFLDLTESEQLNLPGFESHVAGIAVAFDMDQSPAVTRTVEIINYTLPRPVPVVSALVALPVGVQLAASRCHAAARAARGNSQISVASESYAVIADDGRVTATQLTAHGAHRTARTGGGTAVSGADFVDMGSF